MVLKNYATGLQHVGIPTDCMDESIAYYEKLGFETVYQTMNGEKKVAFLKLQSLMIELYDTDEAAMHSGAVNHIAIDVTNIEAVFSYVEVNGFNNTNDTIHTLPFWENGVRYFVIEGPNKERIEFNQKL